MRNIIFLLAILTSLTTPSCYTCWVRTMPLEDVVKNIEFCYDGKYTGLDTIIPINGYYKTIRNITIWNNELKKSIPDVDTISMVFYSHGLFYAHYYWGNYKVIGDIIITNIFSPPCGMSWGGWESKYIMNADTTLTEFYARPLKTETSAELKHYSKTRKEGRENSSNAYFEYSDSLPEIDNCWLLESNWFKCEGVK